MKKSFVLAALAAGTLLSGIAQAAVIPYATLNGWKADAGSWTRDTTFGDEYSSITGLTLDNGTVLSFSGATEVRNVGSSWSTWSGGYSDDVLFAEGATSFTINFDTPVLGFGLFAEPNPFSIHKITLTMADGSFVGYDISGDSGAGFLGFLGTGVTSATVTSDVDFAIGDFYVVGGAPAVPEPATWAMMIAGMGVVGASLRRRATKVSFA